jgi:hypothetical protein
MVQWAKQVAARRGPHVAIMALARKLAHVLYALWEHQATYGPLHSAQPAAYRRLSAHTLAINGCPQAMTAHENRQTSLPHGGAIALIRMRLAHRFDSSPAPSNGHYVLCFDSHCQNADGASTRMPRNGSRINRS